MLDANKTAGGKAQHRIFTVKSGKTLTLKDLKLTGGMAPTGGNGGSIFIEGGGTANLTNCTVTDCQGESGGGIFNRGTLTVSGGSFTKNKATARNGGAICNMGTLSLQDGCTVGGSDAADANEAQYGAGIYTEGGTVTMTGCTLARNKAVTEGGGICAKKDGSTAAAVTITGGTIEANTAAEFPSVGFGGGISINEGCTLTIQGNVNIKDNMANVDGGGIYTGGTVTVDQCTITGNETNEGNGGGVCAVRVSGGDPCTVTLTRCTIGGSTAGDGNTAAASGGGIYTEGGTVTMSGGEIKGNNAANSGGGIALDKSGTLTLSGGKITGNNAKDGSGICIGTRANTDDNTGTVTMTGGEVSNNTATDYGGGVAVLHGSFTMSNGKVSGNTATKAGGGIYGLNDSKAKGEITVSGGEISGNTANMSGSLAGGGIYSGYKLTVSSGEIKNNSAPNGRGGGIALSHSGTFDFTGGTVSGNTVGNTSGSEGQGIYVSLFKSGRAYMKMSGSAKVDANNDVFLGKKGSNPTERDAFIIVTGTLTNTPAATLTMRDDENPNFCGYVAGRVVVKGSGYTLTEGDIAKFPITKQTKPSTQNWTTELDIPNNQLKLKEE